MSLLDDVFFEVPLGFHSLTQRCAALVRDGTYAFPHMLSTAMARASTGIREQSSMFPLSCGWGFPQTGRDRSFVLLGRC